MDYQTASRIAEEIQQILSPYCERIEIAGSVRRKKPDGIKDIELVAVPKYVEREAEHSGLDNFLTGEEIARYTEKCNLLDRQLRFYVEGQNFPQLFTHGEMRGPKKNIKAPFSSRYYALKYRECPLDLFCILPPAQWGVVFTIRTGSAEFSHWLVQAGWRYGLKFEEGRIVQRVLDSTTMQMGAVIGEIMTPEETDVFRILKLPYVEPQFRTKEKTWELDSQRSANEKRLNELAAEYGVAK